MKSVKANENIIEKNEDRYERESRSGKGQSHNKGTVYWENKGRRSRQQRYKPGNTHGGMI